MTDDRKPPSYSKKQLEHIDTLITHMDLSRTDLFNATKSLLMVCKLEQDRVKSLEHEVQQLQKDNGELEQARNVLQTDLLRLRDAYDKEVMRSDELVQEVQRLQGTLPTSDQELDVASNGTEEDSLESKVEEEELPEAATSHGEDSCEEDEATKAVEVTADATDATNASQGTPRATATVTEAGKDIEEQEQHVAASNVANMPEIVSSSTVEEDAWSPFRDSIDGSVSIPRTTLKQRKHQFEEMSKLRFNVCQLCQCTIMPMSKYFSCLHCTLKVDRACHDRMPAIGIPCTGQRALSLADLVALADEPAVPELIRECCQQIEQRSGATERVYQDPEDCRVVSKLFAKYVTSKNVAALKLHKLDIGLVGALVLHLLSNLDGPLIEGKLWQDFARASDQKHPEQRAELLDDLLRQLSKPNRHVLAFMLLHLKRLSALSFSTGQSKQSVANVFGPIIAASPTSRQAASKHEQTKLANMQRQIVLALLELSTERCKSVLGDNRETVLRDMKRRTTNYAIVLMNERQRKSFGDNLSSSTY